MRARWAPLSSLNSKIPQVFFFFCFFREQHTVSLRSCAATNSSTLTTTLAVVVKVPQPLSTWQQLWLNDCTGCSRYDGMTDTKRKTELPPFRKQPVIGLQFCTTSPSLACFCRVEISLLRSLNSHSRLIIRCKVHLSRVRQAHFSRAGGERKKKIERENDRERGHLGNIRRISASGKSSIVSCWVFFFLLSLFLV